MTCERRRSTLPDIEFLNDTRTLANIVDPGGHDEVVLRQPVNLVGVQSDFHLSPSEQDVRVMPLLLGDRADFINEFQSRLEIWERERPHDVVLINGGPAGGMPQQAFEFASLDGRHPALAGNTFLASEVRRIFWHG